MSEMSCSCSCTRVYQWLENNLGNLGALTNTDCRALDAAIHIVELYAYGRNSSVLAAFKDVVSQMQKSTRQYAYHAIAMVMDWPDRAEIWEMAGLPAIKMPWVCKGERR